MPSPFPGMDPYLESEDAVAQLPASARAMPVSDSPAGSRRPLPRPRRSTTLWHRTSPVHVGRPRGTYRGVHRNPPAHRRQTGHAPRCRQSAEQDHRARSLRLPRQLPRLPNRLNANLVEIDLNLGEGQPTLEYSCARRSAGVGLRRDQRARSAKPEQYEIYTATLQKRLPRFRLPLAADDRETVLDLQTAVARCYDQGGFASKIDYTRDPATTLTPEDKKWLNEILKQNKLR